MNNSYYESSLKHKAEKHPEIKKIIEEADQDHDRELSVQETKLLMEKIDQVPSTKSSVVAL